MLLKFLDYWELFQNHVIPNLDTIDMIMLEMTCGAFASTVEKTVRRLKKTYSSIHQVFFKRVLAMDIYTLDLNVHGMLIFRVKYPGFRIVFRLVLQTNKMIFNCRICHGSDPIQVNAMANGEVIMMRRFVGKDRLTPKWCIPIPKQKVRISNYIPLLRSTTTNELLNIYFDKISAHRS